MIEISQDAWERECARLRAEQEWPVPVDTYHDWVLKQVNRMAREWSLAHQEREARDRFLRSLPQTVGTFP